MSLISFNVGESEFHTVSFEINRITGQYKAKVDGMDVLKKFQLVISSREIKFEVGEKEKHKIFITWKVKAFGFWRKIETKVFIDDKLYETYRL